MLQVDHGLYHKSTAKKMKFPNIITKMGINHYKNMHPCYLLQLEMLKKTLKKANPN